MGTESIISKLSSKNKLDVLAELIGFEEMPVDINTYIEDDYYLGKITNNGKGIYKIWKDALNEIYPNPITTKTFVCLNGATRTGKSNTSKIMILYDVYKMLCLGDHIWDFFDLIPRPFFVAICHQSMEKAWDNVTELLEWIDDSPYFQEQKRNPDSLFNMFQFRAAKSPNQFIGKNMPLMWGTELNYFSIDAGTELINAGINRVKGSFEAGFDIFQHIILDSSDTSVDAVVPTFLKKHPFGRYAIQFKYSRYDAKPKYYYNIKDENNIDTDEFITNSLGKKLPNPYYMQPSRTFKVYKGDSEIHATIMPPYGDPISNNTLDKMDPDKFIKVPLELLDEAKADIELFLNEVCGQAVESTSQYFNPQYIVPRFNIPNLVHDQHSHDPVDIVCVDFFNPEDDFIKLFKEAVESIPKDKQVFVRFDLGLVTDRTGFAVGYIQDLYPKNIDGVLNYDPLIKIPIATGISRYTGQQTSIDKLCDLVQWIHSVVPIYMLTTDTFQSFIIQQRCETLGIKHAFLSVDRTYDAYQLFKNLSYRGKVDLPMSNLLKTEALNVFDDGHMINHHDVMNDAQEIGSDSKDVLDAVVGLTMNITKCVTEKPDEVMSSPIVSNSQAARYNKEFVEEWVHQQQIRQWEMMRKMNYGY